MRHAAALMIALIRPLTQPAGVPSLGLDTRRARLARVEEQNAISK